MSYRTTGDVRTAALLMDLAIVGAALTGPPSVVLGILSLTGSEIFALSAGLFLPMAATLLGSSLAACLLMEMWNRAGSRLVLATAFVVAGFVAITALYLEGAAMILAVGAALGQSRPGLLLGAIAMIVATLEVLYGLLLVGSFIWIAVRRRSGGQRAVRNTV